MDGHEQMPASRPRPRELREALFLHANQRYGDFLREQINPGVGERDRLGQPLSRELMRALVATGLPNRRLPAELGGGGVSMTEWGLLLEWTARMCDDMAVSAYLGYRDVVCWNIYQAANDVRDAPARRDHIIDTYLKPTLTGDLFISLAYTDTGDAFAFNTKARTVDGGYLVNGVKPLVSGGTFADCFVTLVANERDDLMALIIRHDDPGLRLVPVATMGVRSLGVVRMELQDVFVPEERVLVAADGLSFAQALYNVRRLGLAAVGVGVMQRFFDQCAAELSQRIRYLMPVTEMQAVQARFGKMHVALESSRAMVHEALDRYTHGSHDDTWDDFSTATKYFVAEQVMSMVQHASHVLGGIGYVAGPPFERTIRDVPFIIHGAGTQGILEVDLGIRAIQESIGAQPRR